MVYWNTSNAVPRDMMAVSRYEYHKFLTLLYFTSSKESEWKIENVTPLEQKNEHEPKVKLPVQQHRFISNVTDVMMQI